jgi:antitoxin (DNA-binding transcriptional repressor) of toxin-antitoxin stability system
MTVIPLEQARLRIDDLLNDVAKGEEVVITRDDGLSFKLVALEPKKKPTFGSAKGLIQMSDDFDEPLDEFSEYMP